MNDKKPESMTTLPLIPIRDLIIFPGMPVPITIGREKSISALEKSIQHGSELFVVTQKDSSALTLERKDVYDIGTVVSLLQIARSTINGCHVLLQGKYRAKIKNFRSESDCYFSDVEKCDDILDNAIEIEASMLSVNKKIEQYAKSNQYIHSDALEGISLIKDPGFFADYIASLLRLQIHDQQEILNTFNVNVRLKILLGYLQKNTPF